MDKKKILKIGGIVGVIAGSIAIYFGGGTASGTVEIVGGVFVLIGIIASSIISEA